MTTAANAVVPANVLPFQTQLPTLADLGVIDATGGTSATVTMVNANHMFYDTAGAILPATPTFAYQAAGGSQDYLGPVIVAKRGQSFNLTVVNSITSHPLATAIDDALDGVIDGPSGDRAKPRTSTHLHGGNTDPTNDGDPKDTFTTSKTYAYGNTQEAAGLWYHDHALGITRLNVLAGLASGYLIRDANDPGDGVRLPAYLPGQNYEVPLIIQDRMFNSNGTFLYPPNVNPGTAGRAWAPEFFGDVATVNGKIWPNLNVDRGKYRFRVYNGSNARFYNLKFKVGITALNFFQIGSDGGLLNAPVKLNKLLLGPGERADLVVDFAALAPNTKVVVTNDANAPFPAGPTAVRRGGMPLPQIMQFTVGSAPGWKNGTGTLPTALRQPVGTGDSTGPITRLAGQPVALTRSMSLVEILNAQGAPLMALLNNRNFETPDSTTYNPPGNPDLPLVTNNPPIVSNTLEQWELINTTGDAHPIHLHFTQFQVLNRQRFDVAAYVAAAYPPGLLQPNTGNYLPPSVTPFLTKGKPSTPAANELGWKDTVVAMPGEVTRILVPFGPNAVPGVAMAIGTAFTGDYVWHCHILEHEDNDMMARFVIEPPPVP